MRWIWALLFVSAVAYATAARNHWLPESIDSATTTSSVTVSEYIVLRDTEINKALVAARKACGDMRVAISRLKEGIGNVDDEGERAISYDEAIVDVVDSLLSDGTVPKGCLYAIRNDRTYGLYGPYEGEVLVLLSTEGDVAIGLAGKAVTPWSRVMAEDSFRPDILLVDDISLVIDQEIALAQR